MLIFCYYNYTTICMFPNFVSSDLSGLELFPELEMLVLDNNVVTESTLSRVCRLPKVHTLSLNKNKISFQSLFFFPLKTLKSLYADSCSTSSTLVN